LSNGGSAASWAFSTAGFNGAGSAKMDFYASPANDQDVLTLPPMDFTAYSTGMLTFDRSHKQYASGYNDNFKIKVSTNCGTTWTTIYNKTGSQTFPSATNLATVSGYTGNVAWTPAVSTDWASDNVNLNSYLGNSAVLVKLEANSGYGNNLYLDNINFNFNTGVSSVIIPVKFDLYPNPVAKNTSVTLQLSNTSDVTLNVVNSFGQIVKTIENKNLTAAEYTFEINTENLSAGIYFINIISGNGTASKKLIIE